MPWILGLAAGVVASGLSIAQNLRRGDPHLISGGPDLFGAMAIAATIYLAVRRVAREGDKRRAWRTGWHMATAASAACAAPMAIFALWYFPTPYLALSAFTAGATFVASGIVGIAAAGIALRAWRRPSPTPR